VKEPATVEAQLAKLEFRGCVVEDRTLAKSVLEKINYYRLANYFSVFQDGGKQFRAGTSFNKILRLYDFDRRLRGQLLIYLEEIEISMRAVISNFHALKYGALGYLNESTFSHHHNHSRFMSKLNSRVEKNTDLGFVSHHNRKYSGSFPLWVIMELFSFGMLSRFFSGLHKQDRKEIAGNLSISAGHLESWLESLSALRNLCAHYSRVYASKIEPVPKSLEDAPFRMDGRLFSFIYIIKLLEKKPFGEKTLLPSLTALLEEYGDAVDLSVLGFPENWEEILS